MNVMAQVQPGASFKDNLAALPSIDGVVRIDLVDAERHTIATIPNEPGKQGSVAVYQYLNQCFGALTSDAAEHGLAIFGEHVADARARPGAHPNIDRLLDVIASDQVLKMEIVRS